MRRVLVTGGAGFLGSHLCRKLIESGDCVVAVDNLSTGSILNLSDISDHENFSFIKHDVSDSLLIDHDLDVVMHLASPASPADFDTMPIQIMKVGGLGTHNMLGLAKVKSAKFFLASTSEVYGDPAVHPQPETYWGNVNPIGPRGVYDEAKRYAEAMTMAYKRQHEVDVCIVRIFNTYGPFMRADDGRVVSNFINQALVGNPLTIHGDGSQTRSLCYVDDQIAGHIALLESNVEGPVNIGSVEEVSILDLAETIIDVTNSSSDLKFLALPIDDPSRRRPDISKAQEELGWNPQVSLRDGIGMTALYWEKLNASSV